jgi:hypothetical protein
MNPLWFLIPAMINGLFTIGVLIASRRNVIAGILALAVVLAIYFSALYFWPVDASPRTRTEDLRLYVLVVAVTWLPGALIALLAGRKWPRLPWLGPGAVAVGLVTGGSFILTTLSLACSMYGDCL